MCLLSSDRTDQLLQAAQSALKTLSGVAKSARPQPGSDGPEPQLAPEERRHAASLMRVNHAGEVCAQALYTAQALATRDAALRAHFTRACEEETDHLAWTESRLRDLNSRPSLLNPVWYAGAFVIGLVAGRLGDPLSLGFVVETERQVEAHLHGHLDRLPAQDAPSRAIVRQMAVDESRHALEAQRAGAAELPPPAKALMRLAGRVMTGTAHYL